MPHVQSAKANIRIDGGLVWCPKGDKFHLDANLASILGVSTQSVVLDGEEYRTYVHPNDLPNVRRIAQAAIVAREPLRLTYALRDRFGVYRDVKVEGFWIENEAGELQATCNRIVERDDADETSADRIADLALQIMTLAAGGQGLPVKLMAEHILIHLMRQDADAKT
ncbi:PAS domain-containing protein [Aureimonas sp. AU22]|uniref:PAS domain-containing protein n=1 Tax=Aureimonas sp. AU22 TaxID=1638162 RepID=UPI00078427FA|nr:PAS domain-containing protein [Aureimonas sp. AU22]